MGSYRRLISWRFVSRSEGAQYIIFCAIRALWRFGAAHRPLFAGRDYILSYSVIGNYKAACKPLPDFSGRAGPARIKFLHKTRQTRYPVSAEQQKAQRIMHRHPYFLIAMRVLFYESAVVNRNRYVPFPFDLAGFYPSNTAAEKISLPYTCKSCGLLSSRNL